MPEFLVRESAEEGGDGLEDATPSGRLEKGRTVVALSPPHPRSHLSRAYDSLTSTKLCL